MIYLKGLKTVSGSAGERVGGQILVPDKVCISAFPGGHMDATAKPTMDMDVQVPPEAGCWKRPGTYSRRLSEVLPDTVWIP